MTAQDYPVTTGYGYIAGYPLNNGFHRGEDRACPVGTSLLINGILVAKTGNTGASTGAHLHIGRFVNGQPTHPNGGGFTLTDATVTETGQNSVDGKFIKVRDASGATWIYDHLSEILIKSGERIESMPTQKEVYDHFHAYDVKGDLANGDPSQKQLDYYSAKPWSVLYLDLLNYNHDRREELENTTKPATPLNKGIYEVK